MCLCFIHYSQDSFSLSRSLSLPSPSSKCFFLFGVCCERISLLRLPRGASINKLKNISYTLDGTHLSRINPPHHIIRLQGTLCALFGIFELFKHFQREKSLIINQGRGVYNNALVYINTFA